MPQEIYIVYDNILNHWILGIHYRCCQIICFWCGNSLSLLSNYMFLVYVYTYKCIYTHVFVFVGLKQGQRLALHKGVWRLFAASCPPDFPIIVASWARPTLSRLRLLFVYCVHTPKIYVLHFVFTFACFFVFVFAIVHFQ